MRKPKRILRYLFNFLLILGLIGILIPFVIFWRGEYVHLLKSKWTRGSLCRDRVIRNLNDTKVNNWVAGTVISLSYGWQAADNRDIFHIFSSYYIIDRDVRYVLIIGVLDKRTYEDLQCALKDETMLKYVPARYVTMWDDQLLCSQTNPIYRAIWDKQIFCRYSPAFYTCEVSKHFRPKSVFLSTTFCHEPSVMHTINYPVLQRKTFTVCVAPLYGPYDNVHELVHMIELNRILGADFFSFYSYNITSRIKKILEYYEELDLVETIEWNFKLDLTKIHYYGQMAALNDCLYRNKHKTHYIVVQDLDEFIIPHKFKTWPELMLDLPHGLNTYSFQSTMFSLDLPDTDMEFIDKDIAVKYRLNSLLKQKHGPVYDKTTRTKYICVASRVEELGIHNTWRLNSASTGNEYHVPPEDGLVFHYRGWFNDKEIFTGWHNTRMMPYKDELMLNVKNLHEKLKL